MLPREACTGPCEMSSGPNDAVAAATSIISEESLEGPWGAPGESLMLRGKSLGCRGGLRRSLREVLWPKWRCGCSHKHFFRRAHGEPLEAIENTLMQSFKIEKLQLYSQLQTCHYYWGRVTKIQEIELDF